MNIMHDIHIDSDQRTGDIPVPPPPRTDDRLSLLDPFSEAGRKLLLQHLYTMIQYVPAAISGEDVEGVHQMRVNIRRFRSTFKLFGHAFPPAYRQRILTPYKYTTATLGDVRDMDVLLMHVHQYRNEHPSSIEALEPLRIHLQSTQRTRHTALRRWLTSKKYARFIDGAVAQLTAPFPAKRSTPPATQRTLRATIPYMIYSAMENVETALPAHKRLRTEEYHIIRIKCKQLRYTLESFKPLLGAEILPMLKHLKRLQDTLGDMNDAAVMLEIMDSLQYPGASVHEEWQAYIDYLRKEIQTAKKSFLRNFKRVFSAENRAAIAHAIAGLYPPDE